MNPRAAIFIAIAGEVIIAGLSLLNYGVSLEALQAATRYSGRFSLLLFSFIFLLLPAKSDILSRILSKNYLTVFAIAHGIHLGILLSYVYLSGIPLVPHRLAGGFLAYAMIFVMPWIQKQNESGKVSEQKYKTLGYVYLFYVWFIFFMTYLARVNKTFPNAGGSYTEHVALMGWVCIMLGYKLSNVFRSSFAKTSLYI